MDLKHHIPFTERSNPPDDFNDALERLDRAAQHMIDQAEAALFARRMRQVAVYVPREET